MLYRLHAADIVYMYIKQHAPITQPVHKIAEKTHFSETTVKKSLKYLKDNARIIIQHGRVNTYLCQQ